MQIRAGAKFSASPNTNQHRVSASICFAAYMNKGIVSEPKDANEPGAFLQVHSLVLWILTVGAMLVEAGKI